MNTPPPTLLSAPPELVKEVAATIVEAVNLRHWEPDTLTAEVSLRTGGLELDSVDMLEIIVAIEHRFDVKVPDAAAGERHFRTIGSIALFVAEGRPEQFASGP